MRWNLAHFLLRQGLFGNVVSLFSCVLNDCVVVKCVVGMCRVFDLSSRGHRVQVSFFRVTVHSRNKSVGTSRLTVVAIVGDNPTDSEEDARWTLGPRGPMGTDGWVGGTHTGSAGWGASTKTGKRRKRSHHPQWYYSSLLTSQCVCVCVSMHLTFE